MKKDKMKQLKPNQVKVLNLNSDTTSVKGKNNPFSFIKKLHWGGAFNAYRLTSLLVVVVFIGLFGFYLSHSDHLSSKTLSSNHLSSNSVSTTTIIGSTTSITNASTGSPVVPSSQILNLPAVSLTGTLESIACGTSNFCITVGRSNGNGVVYVTDNAGVSFASEIIPNNVGYLNSVACPTAINCIAVGLNSIIYTTNSGITWNLSSSFLKNVDYTSIYCISSTNCIVVGSQAGDFTSDTGVIMSSYDGGNTFIQDKYQNNISGLQSVICYSQTDCISVGGTVVISTDSGKSWQLKPISGGMDSFSSVSCVSNSVICIAVGPNASGSTNSGVYADAIYTTDGGNTFGQFNLGTGSAYVRSIACNQVGCMALGPSPTTNNLTNEFYISASSASVLSSKQVVLTNSDTLLNRIDTGLSDNFYGMGLKQQSPVIFKLNQNTATQVGN